MFYADRFAKEGPANTAFHVRLQLHVSRVGLPYVRPVITLTTRSGARL